jgi:hypothetical protein
MVPDPMDAIICIVPDDQLEDARELYRRSDTRPETLEWLKETLTNLLYVKFTPPPAATSMPGRKPYYYHQS